MAGLHITAAFLGTVSEARLAALMLLCGPVPPPKITLDRLQLVESVSAPDGVIFRPVATTGRASSSIAPQ